MKKVLLVFLIFALSISMTACDWFGGPKTPDQILGKYILQNGVCNEDGITYVISKEIEGLESRLVWNSEEDRLSFSVKMPSDSYVIYGLVKINCETAMQDVEMKVVVDGSYSGRVGILKGQINAATYTKSAKDDQVYSVVVGEGDDGTIASFDAEKREELLHDMTALTMYYADEVLSGTDSGVTMQALGFSNWDLT